MSLRRIVYLDHSATTPTDPRVVEAMLPYLTNVNLLGRQAQDAVESACATVAGVLNCKPAEILFTSGGSASDNLAIRQAAWSARQQSKGQNIITSPIEHEAVLKTVDQLVEIMGFQQTVLPVDHNGAVSSTAFSTACQPETVLASIMLANNEVGTLQPIGQLASLAKEQDILFHTDAVQAVGQMLINVQELGVDFLSLSAHKFYGPKGIGVLYMRENALPEFAVGDENLQRSAEALNVALIVGLARALELIYAELSTHVSHLKHIRNMLINRVLNEVPGVVLTGHPDDRLPSHASFIIDEIESNKLIMHLDTHGIAASSASACKTGNPEPSNVLLAMGYSAKEALGSLRLTVGRQTTEEDVDYTVNVLASAVEKLRKLNRELVQ